MSPIIIKSPAACEATGTQSCFDYFGPLSKSIKAESCSQGEKANLPQVKIACDGGASPNPGPAGWAYVMDSIKGRSEAFGDLSHASTNVCSEWNNNCWRSLQ